jgi:SAM-dependent methyltransferase
MFSGWAQILILVMAFYVVYRFFARFSRNEVEGFTDQIQDDFTFKTGPAIYDDFYASIYDQLVYSGFKTEYEIGEIVNKTTPSSHSILLDVGCGTGHHVAEWISLSGNSQAKGMDQSPAMIEQAKKNYPEYDFEVKDALETGSYQPNEFTHITCLYFTFYYWTTSEKEHFLQNAMLWLKPGGYLCIHLVNPEQFDPILPPANPLLLISPQKYAQKRITQSTIQFESGTYEAEYQEEKDDAPAKFIEKLSPTNQPNKTRKHEHVLYMEPIPQSIQHAKDTGFIVLGLIDLVNCQYEYQYVYIFQKPE